MTVPHFVCTNQYISEKLSNQLLRSAQCFISAWLPCHFSLLKLNSKTLCNIRNLLFLFFIQAACDSLQLMGNRKFYDQMTADLCQHEKDKITDEIDITTMKDYMRVWKKLSLTLISIRLPISKFGTVGRLNHVLFII